MDAQERTEPATPKRRERARAQGDHARSALASFSALMWLGALPPFVAQRFAAWWSATLGRCAIDGMHAARSVDAHADISAMVAAAHAAAPWWAVGVASMSALLASVASSAACGSIGWSPGALRWRGVRLSPAAGFRSLFSRDSLAQTAFALSSAVAVMLCAVPAARMLVEGSASAHTARAAAALAYECLTAFWWRAALAASAIALVDVALARRRQAFRLRMSRREVRDEQAEQEGRPEIKARRRSIALRRSARLRVAALKRAAVVLTNPTHVAVALEYAPPQIEVPIVSAAGADAAAAIVRTAAAFYDVPIVESAQLARALFARVAVDEPIPEELYAGIAAVFAWVLKTRGRLGAGPVA